jgi:lipid-A-disaccharide synthase
MGGSQRGGQTPNIAIISGEMSGDVSGGALARELLRLRPDLRLWGIGSRQMAAAGVELLYDSAQWSAISIVETLKLYPKLRWSAFPAVVREALKRRPAAVVLIDFGAFNVKVASKLKPRGIPVLYYFPPGSWRKQGKVNPQIARVTDRIATPFPWSEERLRSVGARATFVGHPLLEIVKPTLSRVEFADRFGMDPAAPIVGLLPGSRSFEVEHNTPAMLRAAQIIREKMADAQFVFGLASPAARARVESVLKEWFTRQQDAAAQAAESDKLVERGRSALEETLGLGKRGARLVTPEGVLVSADALRTRSADGDDARWKADIPPVVLTEGMTYDVMAHSDALIVCSGTATLEAALLGTPMVILYRGSQLMELEARLLKIRPEHIGMPNIIAGRRIVPEFIQDEASPEALAEHTLRFIGDPAARGEVKASLQAVRDSLGKPGASERTARMTLELAGLI